MTFKVGKFIVYVREFEALCLNIIESSKENSLLVIDEIGKMELLSRRFEDVIKQFLTSPNNLKIIATVPLKSPVSLVDDLKKHQKSQLFKITKSNREEIYNEILQAAQKMMS